MTKDPYQIAGTGTEQGAAGADRHGIGALRTFLWTVLVVSAAGNAVTSMGGLPIAVSLSFGVVTALCSVALILDRFRGGRA